MNENLRTAAKGIARMLGYDPTHQVRAAAYGAVEERLSGMPCERLDALEIAANWKWQQRQWGSFTEMNWPEYDICRDVLDRRFDIIIADNVWEHLPYPGRAARHVLEMLKPGGLFVNITPFLIRYHAVPIDCTRWTETGMRYLLAEAGFDEDAIETGSWGNAGSVKANLRRWKRTGWGLNRTSDPRFPVMVWAFARKQA